MKIDQNQFLISQAERARAEELHRRQEETSGALVARIVQARQDAEEAATRLHEAATELRLWSRKVSDDNYGVYTTFANAHMRLAGAMIQSSKRTIPMDRLLNNAKREQEETRVREEGLRKQQDVRAHQMYVQKLTLPSDDAFDDLYGEILTDAQ